MPNGAIDTVTQRSTVLEGAVPHTDQIQSEAVLTVGDLTPGGALSAELRDAKRTIGF